MIKSRSFDIADLMILIASSGVGMAGWKSIWLGFHLQHGVHWWNATPIHSMYEALIAAWLSPLTMACLAIRIRRRKPSWRRTAILPGTAGSIACAVVVANRTALMIFHKVLVGFYDLMITNYKSDHYNIISIIDKIIHAVFRGSEDPSLYFSVHAARLAVPCGYAVAAVWTVLAVSGRWRIERSWIDRFGRILGAAWILLAIVAAIAVE